MGFRRQPAGGDRAAARRRGLAGRHRDRTVAARPGERLTARRGPVLRRAGRRGAPGARTAPPAGGGQPRRRPRRPPVRGQPTGRPRERRGPLRLPRLAGPADPRLRPARPGPGRRGVRGPGAGRARIGGGAGFRQRRHHVRRGARSSHRPGRDGQVAARRGRREHRGGRVGRLHHPRRGRSGRRLRAARRGGRGSTGPVHRGARRGRRARPRAVLPQLRIGGRGPGGPAHGRHRHRRVRLPRHARRHRSRPAHPGPRLGGPGPSDWISDVPNLRLAGLGHGADPTSAAFGARTVPAADVHGHTGYLVPGTQSLAAFAAIAKGEAR